MMCLLQMVSKCFEKMQRFIVPLVHQNLNISDICVVCVSQLCMLLLYIYDIARDLLISIAVTLARNIFLY